MKIDFGIFSAQVVTFLIATFILWKFFWKELLNIILQRREKIRFDLEMIEKSKDAAEKLEAEYKERLERVQDEARQIINVAKQEASKVKTELIQQAHHEAQETRKKAQLQLQGEEGRMLNEMISEVMYLSMEIAEKMMDKSVDKDTHEKLFNDIIKNLDSESLVYQRSKLH